MIRWGRYFRERKAQYRIGGSGANEVGNTSIGCRRPFPIPGTVKGPVTFFAFRRMRKGYVRENRGSGMFLRMKGTGRISVNFPA